MPANSQALSCVTGCVPSSIASRACTYSKFNCTGSRESMFWSEKKNLRLSSNVSFSTMPCSRRVFEGSTQFTSSSVFSFFRSWSILVSRSFSSFFRFNVSVPKLGLFSNSSSWSSRTRLYSSWFVMPILVQMTTMRFATG